MPYFSVHALDAPGKAEARAAARADHRARLRVHDHEGLTVHIGGPLLNDQGAMCGSLLVIEAADAQAVQDFVASDPYTVAGVYQSVDIHAFNWGLGHPED